MFSSPMVCVLLLALENLGGRFDILYFFLLGGVRGARSGGGGDRIFIENPRRGGVSRRGKGRGAGRVELGKFFWGGGGLMVFFFGGRNVHQKIVN